jgi:hypothetical protein
MRAEQEHFYAITEAFDHEHRWGTKGSPSLDASIVSHPFAAFELIQAAAEVGANKKGA